MKIDNKQLIRFKVYYDRGKTYWSSLAVIIGIITMMGVFKDSKAISWFFKHPYINSIWLSVLIVLGFIFVGFLDKKLRVREKEQQEIGSTNPYIRETHAIVKQLKQQLDEITMDRDR